MLCKYWVWLKCYRILRVYMPKALLVPFLYGVDCWLELCCWLVAALVFAMALILRVWPPLLSSLAPCEDEPTRHGGGDLILLRAVKDCRLLWSLSLYLLVVVGVYLECQAEGCVVLVFDLVDVAKALVQFERSSDASQESRGHCIACTSDGCWGSISCTVPLLACRLNLCLLWSRYNSCAPIKYGWSMARTACPLVAEGCYELPYNTSHNLWR
jgi:hypothetical protein